MRARRAIGVARIGAGALVLGVLAHTYALQVVAGEWYPFDYFGYFTNQTNLLMAVVMIVSGLIAVRGRSAPRWLSTARGIGTTCLIVVSVVYNALLQGLGTAPAWVSTILHVVFPLAALLDWACVGDRPRLAWRRLWLVLPYPCVWLVVVLIRGATDGWVPYGFLLPERGAVSLLLHVLGLLVTLLIAGALVWILSRLRGLVLLRPAA